MTRRIGLHVLFDVSRNRLNIKPEDEHSRAWQEKADPQIAALLNGLLSERRVMTNSLLEEIARSIGKLAAETGDQVRVRFGTGKVVAHIPEAFKPGIRDVLGQIKQARM